MDAVAVLEELARSGQRIRLTYDVREWTLRSGFNEVVSTDLTSLLSTAADELLDPDWVDEHL